MTDSDPIASVPVMTQTGRRGRPPGKAKLPLTPETICELVRRVKIRLEGEKHSSRAIAGDFGVSEATIVSAIRRLRLKGML